MRGIGDVDGLDPSPGAARARTAERSEELDLNTLGKALWARRRWIVLPTLIAFVLTFVAVNLMTPVYTSESRILIENRETAFFRPEIERGGGSADRALIDQEAVTSQVQLLLSRDLGREVVRALKLGEHGEFDSGPAFPFSLMRLIGLGHDDAMAAEERVLRAYFKRLKVYSIDKSRVIAIEFESQDPDLAAKVANTIAESYLGLQQLAKQDSTRQASLWLQGEIEKLRHKVAEAEGRVEAFRASANLFIGVNNTQLSNQQLGELNTQLGTSRSQKVEAEAKARLIRDMLASGRAIEVSDITNSELIRRLVEQRATLIALLAEQSSTLLERHPRIKELRAQIGGLDGQIRSEAERMVRAFEADAQLAEARMDELSRTLDQLKRQAAESGEQDVQLRALEREAKAQRDLLESYLARYRDSAARDTLSALPADARIISRATPAIVPSFPKKLPMIALVTLATLVLSAGFLASAELVGGRAQRVPARSPAVALGAAARAEDATPDPEPDATAPLARRLSELVGAHGPGLVAVTPATAEVATAPITAKLARDLAWESGSTVLIELDAPAPSLVADPTAPGIVDLVRGTASFGQVIHRDSASRLHIVPAGNLAADDENILASDRLAMALSALAQTYDHVVLAAPPAAALATASFAAQLRLAVVVGPKAWAPGEAEAAYDLLSAAGVADLIAVVEDESDTAAPGADHPVLAA